jgi:hypothetical protein
MRRAIPVTLVSIGGLLFGFVSGLILFPDPPPKASRSPKMSMANAGHLPWPELDFAVRGRAQLS